MKLLIGLLVLSATDAPPAWVLPQPQCADAGPFYRPTTQFTGSAVKPISLDDIGYALATYVPIDGEDDLQGLIVTLPTYFQPKSFDYLKSKSSSMTWFPVTSRHFAPRVSVSTGKLYQEPDPGCYNVFQGDFPIKSQKRGPASNADK